MQSINFQIQNYPSFLQKNTKMRVALFAAFNLLPTLFQQPIITKIAKITILILCSQFLNGLQALSELVVFYKDNLDYCLNTYQFQIYFCNTLIQRIILARLSDYFSCNSHFNPTNLVSPNAVIQKRQRVSKAKWPQLSNIKNRPNNKINALSINLRPNQLQSTVSSQPTTSCLILRPLCHRELLVSWS